MILFNKPQNPKKKNLALSISFYIEIKLSIFKPKTVEMDTIARGVLLMERDEAKFM